MKPRIKYPKAEHRCKRKNCKIHGKRKRRVA